MYEKGIISADGSKREYDVVIWATGFLGTSFAQSLPNSTILTGTSSDYAFR